MGDELADLLANVDLEALGRRIKLARVNAELTQGQLAGDNASIGYMSRIESGQRRPDMALLEQVALRLRTTPYVLLTGTPDPTRDRLKVALDHAELALRGGSAGDADELLKTVEAEIREYEDDDLTARWSYLRALVLESTGDLDRAIIALEDLSRTNPAHDDATRYAIALSRCYRESGDLTRAIAVGQAQLDQLQQGELDGTDETIQLAVTVAAAHFLLGDVGHAVRLSHRAIARAEQLGSPVAMASAYWNASVMESRRGNHPAAVPLAEKALRLLESNESNRNLARLRSQLGIFQLRLDPPEIDAARANFEAAAQQFEWSSASPIDIGRNTVALARADLLSGSAQKAYDEAARVLDQLRAVAPHVAVGALIVMGQAILELGGSDDAVAHYRDAVGLLTGVGSDRSAAEAWFELGVLLDEAGLGSEANDAFRRAAASTGLASLQTIRSRASTS